jgi:hypothetical protein
MRGEETDANDHKLRGFNRSDSDYDDQATVVDIGLGHCGPVTLNEERFFFLRSFKRTIAPNNS